MHVLRSSLRAWVGLGAALGALVALGALAASVPRGIAKSSDRRAPLGEATRWLQGYLRIDTTNPPGNEGQAASYLAQLLHREGIPTQLLVTSQGRANLYARLEAENPRAGAVVLLHHMDAVAPGDGWSVDPFSGELRNEKLWGRGAIDAKSLGIAHLAAFIELKRRQVPLQKDVVFLAVADEERGGEHGTAWLLEHHPEVFADVEAVLNEGGSNKVIGERLLWWGVEVAQKRPLWVRVSAQGRGGHGSGLNPHSATHQLLRGLTRALDLQLPYRVTPAAHQYFRSIAPFHGERFRQVFDHGRLEVVQQRFGAFLEAQVQRVLLPGMPVFFVDTVQVTSVEAGVKTINVVADGASALIDIRLLPDTDTESFLRDLQEALGRQLEVEVLLSSPPSLPSPTSDRTFEALSRVLAARAPVIPAFITGTTDSRYFRQRGIPAYGFAPFTLNGEESAGIHGQNESIPVKKFGQGVETMFEVVLACVAE